ncbi:hypothetical protein BC830DRAFT_1115848 [Chytriomyces sp. MP71]|nr:hypothetical protein BC830DRAFT_1115848 [Chytriomyces sp. MP71]
MSQDLASLLTRVEALRVTDPSVTPDTVASLLKCSLSVAKKAFVATEASVQRQKSAPKPSPKPATTKSASRRGTAPKRAKENEVWAAARSLFSEGCTSEATAQAALAFRVASKMPAIDPFRDTAFIEYLSGVCKTIENEEWKKKQIEPAIVYDSLFAMAGIAYLTMRLFMPRAPFNYSDNAIKFCKLNMSEYPDYKIRLASAYTLQSGLNALCGDIKKAAADLDEALILNPDCVVSRSRRCILLYRSGMGQEALYEAMVIDHVAPEGIHNDANPFFMASLTLWKNPDNFYAGKFWYDKALSIQEESDEPESAYSNEAKSRHASLSKKLRPKQFDDLHVRHDTSLQATTFIDQVADHAALEMLKGNPSRHKKALGKRNYGRDSFVDPASLDPVNSASHVDDGDQTALQGPAAQDLRSEWAEGMDYCPPQGQPLLHFKCFMGDIKWVQENTRWDRINESTSGMRLTPLMVAIQGCRQIQHFTSLMDHVAVAELLLEKGARVDARDVVGCTALFHATGHGNNEKTLRIAELLIMAGANVNIQNRFGCTALMTPTIQGSQKATQLLCSNGCDPKIPDYEGAVPMEIASSRPSILQILSQSETKRQQTTASSAPSPTCDHCGETDVKLSFCQGCMVKRYCSTACQKSAWKTGHKTECSTVKLSVAKIQPVQAGLSVRINPAAPAPADGESREDPTGRMRTVKIQYASDGVSMLCYDRKRRFERQIMPSDASFSEIARMIRQKGVLGRKAYFRARFEGDEMIVLTDDVLPPCEW